MDWFSNPLHTSPEFVARKGMHRISSAAAVCAYWLYR